MITPVAVYKYSSAGVLILAIYLFACVFAQSEGFFLNDPSRHRDDGSIVSLRDHSLFGRSLVVNSHLLSKRQYLSFLALEFFGNCCHGDCLRIHQDFQTFLTSKLKLRFVFQPQVVRKKS